MLRVIVRQARPGMTLARSILNPRQPDSVLLTSGYTLTAPVIARLHEIGVYDLWVRYPGLDFLDDLISPDLSANQQRLCETLKLGFHAQAQRTWARLPINEYRDAVQELVRSLVCNPANLSFMSDLGSVDDVLLRHSAEVCYLAVIIGLRLEAYLVDQRRRIAPHRAKEVVNLGIGCMLHDIGEIQLPELQRESRRNEDDADPLWKQHVELGYRLVQPQAEPSAAAVVLQHHQHFDGTGFPEPIEKQEPLAGRQIHVFARIAAAADTFQHLMHRDGMPMPAIFALWKIQQPQYRAWFDPIVMNALLSVTPPFLPGMIVQLSDRRNAVVVENNESTPCYPRVQILDELHPDARSSAAPETIDLSGSGKLLIEKVDGYDITPYFYGPRIPAPPASSPFVPTESRGEAGATSPPALATTSA